MKEIWKEIKGYEGLYLVSNLGRVESVKRIVKSFGNHTRIQYPRMKAISNHSHGYKQVNLWKDGKSKNHYVHRLMCETFIPNPENKRTVNHKDGNKANNVLDNLEWMTDRENNQHSIDVLGRTVSLETRLKNRESKLGKKNPNYKHGKRAGQESRVIAILFCNDYN